jgi:hypothetical protein
MKLKFILFLIVLLVVSVGIVAAQSSSNFVVQRHVVGSGGVADSANYKVTSVIGQQATDVGGSANFKVSAGFLYPLEQGSKIYLPIVIK